MRSCFKLTSIAVIETFLLLFIAACSAGSSGDENLKGRKGTEEKISLVDEKDVADKDIISIDDLNEAIREKPGSADAYYNRGSAYLDASRYEEAIRDFEKAVELDPYKADAFILRGIAYAELGDFENAIGSFEKAIELEPENTTAYINRGTVYSIMDNLELACMDWKKACILGECRSRDISIVKGECNP